VSLITANIPAISYFVIVARKNNGSQEGSQVCPEGIPQDNVPMLPLIALKLLFRFLMWSMKIPIGNILCVALVGYFIGRILLENMI
jgi:hypothetical protein